MKLTDHLCIATRKSSLALKQANDVKNQLQLLYPDIAISLVPITTKGDKMLKTSLAKIGGKGLFVKELEQALIEKKADIAVHSMKDVPPILPEGLVLSSILERIDPRDSMLSNHYKNISDLPSKAVIGTSSLRRQCQLKNKRPDLNFKVLRGNIHTRINKLDEGQFDAIILAAAGLIRIGLDFRISQMLPISHYIPASGQGAIVIECRENDDAILELLAPLNHMDTAQCVLAERRFVQEMNGNCQTPLACYAHLDCDQIILNAMIGYPDGSNLLKTSVSMNRSDYIQAGTVASEQLKKLGGAKILEFLECYNDHE